MSGGLAVYELARGGSAAKCGLQAWDVIVEMNQTNIRGFSQEEIMRLIKRESQLAIHVFRPQQISSSGPPVPAPPTVAQTQPSASPPAKTSPYTQKVSFLFY